MSAFHTTPADHAKGGKSKKKRKGKGDEPDPRIINLKSSMPRAVPAPLRFARNRALRHWTIHRAWLLFQRKEREREAHELERMYQSMHNAAEELRQTSGPGTREEGFLYRVAMEKKGVYGHNAVPIEYARPQTETPAREPWNHGWTR
ncbi:Uu.00g013600.m01.CDS01 [Anthostomella pinea]|uniref:Large ribosomal subunit protein mL40 n=1 Tax=Anthostomella pinea TaxID=933095 RepID=A0AAI8VSE3_9PEZI|nr:Uu.00g013600.m01.CDS01 [Anthostomella pinea]